MGVDICDAFKELTFVECPVLSLVVAYVVAQLIAALVAVYANWSFAAASEGILLGWDDLAL
ncbi:H[+]-ATPase 4 [Actinidia rufa]|uniref:H[+]-ATPase 4 n=1 Tax=Actinidia rufa TaxID=165716 RepID=A0A7J0DGL4_9ERIC|nr:H[+]-ATPase 4 [Actinidia rufa]